MKQKENTPYFLRDVRTGESVDGFDDDHQVMSPEPPKVGEYLNQSGCHFEVVTLLQHFDAGYIEVYVKSVGDSTEFLKRLQEKYL